MSNVLDLGHGLSLTFTRDATNDNAVPTDVWVNFRGEDGKAASISIAAYVEKTGSIIGGGLRSWASDRINEHMAAKIAEEDAAEERAAHGQFGVGA